MNRAGYHDSENDHGFLIIFGDGENVDFSIKFENWQQMKPTFDKICDLSTGLYDDNDQKIQHPFLILIPEGETEKISPDQVKIVIDGTLYDFETWADILPPRDRTWTEAISETASTLSESAADLTQSAGRLFGNVTGRFRKSLDNTNQARDEKIQKSPLILNWSNDQKVKSN